MYNRYTPRPDGSYQRKRIPDPAPAQQGRTKPPENEFTSQPVCKQSFDKPVLCPESRSFLGSLLPKNLDTGDLLIIVLLLLVSRDCPEESGTALLTLALYLIM